MSDFTGLSAFEFGLLVACCFYFTQKKNKRGAKNERCVLLLVPRNLPAQRGKLVRRRKEYVSLFHKVGGREAGRGRLKGRMHPVHVQHSQSVKQNHTQKGISIIIITIIRSPDSRLRSRPKPPKALLFLLFLRILQCHSFTSAKIDPLPE